MKIKEHRGLWIVAVIAAGLYVLATILSVSLILYGSHQYAIHRELNDAFRIGNILIYAWMTNPIPLILALFGLRRDRNHRKRYWSLILLTSLAWLLGGMMIARYF